MDTLDYLRTDLAYIAFDVCTLTLALIALSRNAYTAVSAILLMFLTIKLTVIVGMRPLSAGNDTLPYYRTFQAIEGVGNARDVGASYYGNTELLYWPSAAVFKWFSDEFTLFLTLSILASAALVYFGNRGLAAIGTQHSGVAVGAIAALMTYLAFMTYEIAYFGGHIRAAIGVPLVLLSFYFATRRKLILAALFFLIGLGYHNSSISVLPLLLFQLAFPHLKRSRRNTALLIVSLVLAFLIGQFGQLGNILELLGGFYYDRYIDYFEYTGFNITSVFQTTFFWIILAHIVLFLLLGYREIHIYAFYYMFLVLLFSSTPKISERYFAFILLCLPLLLFISVRERFREGTSIVLVVAFYLAIGLLAVTSQGLLSTLGLTSILLRR